MLKDVVAYLAMNMYCCGEKHKALRHESANKSDEIQ